MPAPTIGLPPWLQIGALDTVPSFLQGVQQGRGMADSSNRASEAAQEIGLRQQAQADRAAESQQELELRQQRQEEVSQIAARQYAGMQSYQQAIQKGVKPLDALIQAAPDMFYSKPEDFATALNRIEVNSLTTMRDAERAAHNFQIESVRNQSEIRRSEDAAEKLVLAGDSLTLKGKALEAQQQAIAAKADLAKSNQVANRAREIMLASELRSIDSDSSLKEPEKMRRKAEISLKYGVEFKAPFSIKSPPPSKAKSEPPPPLEASQPIPESVAPSDSNKGALTEDQARAFLKAAGGDKDKARAMAREAGYKL